MRKDGIGTKNDSERVNMPLQSVLHSSQKKELKHVNEVVRNREKELNVECTFMKEH